MMNAFSVDRSAPAAEEARAGGSTSLFSASLSVQLLPLWLPVATAQLQREESKSSISRLGIEKREAILPICRSFGERLNAIPEAASLRPQVDAYVDGSDPGHFGELLAALLQAFSSTESKDAVKEVMSDVISSVMADTSGLMDSLMSIVFASKGLGKGTSTQATAPINPLGIMQNVFAGGLGMFGKGVGSQTAAPPDILLDEKVPAAPPVPCYDEEVRDLLEMGLVSDAGVAQNLLRSHNGDISKVVDALTS